MWLPLEGAALLSSGPFILVKGCFERPRDKARVS